MGLTYATRRRTVYDMNATQRRKRATERDAKNPARKLPRIGLTISTEERALFEATAKKESLPLSTWIRVAALREASRARATP